MKKRFIVLLTDFSYDYYVGQMKGVIKSIFKDVEIIDLSHNINPQNILQASIIIYKTYKYFPKKSIFLCIVDPEVGSKRDIILVKKESYIFLSPDNGLLTKILDGKFEIYKFYNKKIFKFKNVSNTFHGRDIFAPIAAKLSKGVKIFNMFKKVDIKDIKLLNFPKVEVKFINNLKYFVGKILFFDNFGNLITNIEENILENNKKYFLSVFYKNKLYYRLKLNKFYSEVKEKNFITLINSFGLLEIAQNKGNAYLEFLKKFGDIYQLEIFLFEENS